MNNTVPSEKLLLLLKTLIPEWIQLTLNVLFINPLRQCALDLYRKYRKGTEKLVNAHPDISYFHSQDPQTPSVRIAYIIPGSGIFGGTIIVLEHCNRLLKRGFQVFLINMDNKNPPLDWFHGNRIRSYSYLEMPDNLDIVVATQWSTAFVLNKVDAKKKVYFVQSDETRFYKNPLIKNRVKKTYSLPFIFITEAKWIQKWLKEKFNQESNYVPNALNTAIIHKVETVEPRKTNKIRILLEGGIDIEYKGMEDAFSAVQDLDCEIWCVSNSGKPKDKWKCDKFFENVPFNRMKEIYSSCDILLKMSRIEGFFGPPLEMMVCGGCCVVAKVTGYDEYIIDGFNALVVEERDIEGAKKAVQRLMADPELRQKIILNGLETAKMWSDWEKSIDLLERLYLS